MKKNIFAVISLLLILFWLLVNSASAGYTSESPAIFTLLWWTLPIISLMASIYNRRKIKNALSLIILLLSFIPLIYLIFLSFIGFTFK